MADELATAKVMELERARRFGDPHARFANYPAIVAIIISLIALVVGWPARAENLAPFEFKGVTAGVPVDPKSIRGCDGGASERSCIELQTRLAGVKADTAVTYYNNMLSSVYAVIDRSDFETVLAAVTAKYGPACRSGVEEWRNAMGARLDNQTFTWCFSSGELQLKRIGRKVDQMFFGYADSNQAPPAKPNVDF